MHSGFTTLPAVLIAAASAGALAQPTPQAAAAPAATAAEAPAASLAPVTVTAALPAQRLALDEPASVGSRLGLAPRETPASVTVVDRETIEQRGLTDTQRILESVPGITAFAPPGSPGSVSYRGFGASSLTQMFNGISVQYDAIAARPVDSWIYDRVEVIGGPSGFLHGAGAVGGAINYVTKLPVPEADFTQLRASAGSFDTTQLAAGTNRRFGDPRSPAHALRVDLNRSASNGWVDGNRREAWTGALSLRSAIGPRAVHTLAIEYQDEKVDRPYWGTPLLNPATGDGRIDPATRSRNYNAADGVYEQTVKWARSILEFRASDATTVRNTLYHYDALRDYRNVEVYRYDAANARVVRSAAFLTRHDQGVLGNRVELTHRATLAGLPSDWAAGLDWSVNRQTRFPRSLPATVSTVDPTSFTTESFFAIPGMAPGFDPDRANKLSTLAVFVENRTRLTPALSLVSALRGDRIDLDVTNLRTASAADPAFFSRRWTPVTGRLGVVHQLTPSASLYAQLGTAADPPAGILTTATFAQVRDFDLTTGRQLEAGGKFDLAGGRGAATVAAYRITRRNIAVTDPANPGTTIPVGEQSARGVEVAASLRVTPRLLAQGNLSLVDAHYDDFTENVGGVAVSRAGNRPANVPARVANLWLTWTFSPRLQGGVDARYVSSRFGNAANTVSDPAYTVLGAFASYRVAKATTVTLRVRNLTDTVYAAAITATPMFWLGAPRSVELALQSTF